MQHGAGHPVLAVKRSVARLGRSDLQETAGGGGEVGGVRRVGRGFGGGPEVIKEATPRLGQVDKRFERRVEGLGVQSGEGKAAL